MICQKCGENNTDGYKFCQKCGSPLEAQPQQQAQAAPQPQAGTYQQPAHPQNAAYGGRPQQQYQPYQQYQGYNYAAMPNAGPGSLFDTVEKSYITLVMSVASIVAMACGLGIVLQIAAFVISIVVLVKISGMPKLNMAQLNPAEQILYRKAEKRNSASKVLAIITLIIPVLKIIFIIIFSSTIINIAEQIGYRL